MFITAPNRPLRRQTYATSCWITAAHYILQYLNEQVTLQQLEAQYYRRAANPLLAMEGAGHPMKIINAYAHNTNRVAVTMKVSKVNSHAQVVRQLEKEDFIAAVSGNLREGIPVVASIRSQDVRLFGHALLLTGIEDTTGTVIFKDPGNRNSNNPFATDVRSVPYAEFTTGFSYKYHNTWNMNVTAYCAEITYLKDWGSISLFD